MPLVPPVAIEPAPPAPAELAPTAVETAPASAEDEVPVSSWPDDAMESAFRAEARERGEPVRVARETGDATDEEEGDGLPKLEDLVARLPAAVLESMEDLFRARFVAVRRVPRKALKP